MVAFTAKFDGEKIEVPEELRGVAPGDVLIIYPAREQPALVSRSKTRSFRDFYGIAQTQRTTEEINAQIREERDSWDAS